MTRKEQIKEASQNEMMKYPNFCITAPAFRMGAAIAAMQGIISNNRYNGSTNQVAETAVRYADALINELNKKD